MPLGCHVLLQQGHKERKPQSSLTTAVRLRPGGPLYLGCVEPRLTAGVTDQVQISVAGSCLRVMSVGSSRHAICNIGDRRQPLKTLNVRAERLVIPLQYQYNRSKRLIIIIPDSYFRHGNATRDEDRKPERACVCAWRTDWRASAGAWDWRCSGSTLLSHRIRATFLAVGDCALKVGGATGVRRGLSRAEFRHSTKGG